MLEPAHPSFPSSLFLLLSERVYRSCALSVLVTDVDTWRVEIFFISSEAAPSFRPVLKGPCSFVHKGMVLISYSLGFCQTFIFTRFPIHARPCPYATCPERGQCLHCRRRRTPWSSCLWAMFCDVVQLVMGDSWRLLWSNWSNSRNPGLGNAMYDPL